jgi:hypothetical protein
MSNDEFEEKKSHFNKWLSCSKATMKNNKVKYSTLKQFKTQIMHIRHDIKKQKKIIKN